MPEVFGMTDDRKEIQLSLWFGFSDFGYTDDEMNVSERSDDEAPQFDEYDDEDGPPVCPRCSEPCHWCEPEFNEEE